MIGPYETPQAFRMALETRLRDIAQRQGTDLQRLRRRVAFDQLLAPLFLVDRVLLAHSGRLDPVQVRQSLEATFRTRQTHPLASELPVPPRNWAASYSALAQELGLPVLTLDEAHTYLGAFWQKWGLD